MVWSGDDNTSIFNELVIHGQRISAAGVELGINDFRISDIGRLPYAKDDLRPAVAYNAAANEHLVVWQGTTVDHEREIIGQRLGLATPFLVVAADEGGGPHVRVLDASTLAEKFSFFAYDAAFRGGVRVAAADLDGDGRADLITAAGPGGGPHVRGWSGVDLTDLTGFFAFDPAFTGGVSVAAGAAATSGAALPLASPATAARPADMVPRDQWERIRVAVLQRWEAAGLSADEDADSAVVDLPIAAALALEIKTKLVPRQHSE